MNNALQKLAEALYDEASALATEKQAHRAPLTDQQMRENEMKQWILNAVARAVEAADKEP